MSGPYGKERPSYHFKIDPFPKVSVALRSKRLEIDPGMQPEERQSLAVCHFQRGTSREYILKISAEHLQSPENTTSRSVQDC